MNIKIFYGTNEYKIDVTDICLEKLIHNNIINIPMGDHARSLYFNDPLEGILKKIFIIINNDEYEYDHMHTIKINMIDY